LFSRLSDVQGMAALFTSSPHSSSPHSSSAGRRLDWHLWLLCIGPQPGYFNDQALPLQGADKKDGPNYYVMVNDFRGMAALLRKLEDKIKQLADSAPKYASAL